MEDYILLYGISGCCKIYRVECRSLSLKKVRYEIQYYNENVNHSSDQLTTLIGESKLNHVEKAKILNAFYVD